jgi:putative phosphoribosyl transferase
VDALELPLDVYLVRKLGVPGHEELAMGAIASDGTRVIDEALVARLDIDGTAIAPATCVALGGEVDEVVCAVTPEPFYAVGEWYEDFGQTSDEEVCELLASAHRDRGVAEPAI